jgi:ubiquinone/menaquinone biosynthesis C-methylase UbiE
MVDKYEDEIGPFEWLTSSASLTPILLSLNIPSTDNTALHVGSGSSTLGEYLVEEHSYSHVVNIDIDQETLDQMELRWKRKAPNNHRLEFRCVDLASERVPFPTQFFNLVMDKSALDCTLCSDKATTGLLCETYRVLKPNGVYFVVSFHHPDFLVPLLRDLPGADWIISHQLLRRHLDDVTGSHVKHDFYPTSLPVDEVQQSSSRWASGSFDPDKNYDKTVNVLICRKSNKADHDDLNPDAIHQHIYETNKSWFQSQDPMVTSSRKDELISTFGLDPRNLEETYLIIFTDAEREHLDFDFFMEDWRAFLESRPTIATTTMTVETAIEFLEEMQ